MRYDWLAEAEQMPIAFAQVREDPEIDAALVEGLRANPRVLMIASGGCTAALLASKYQFEYLHLVDPNPAQLALARLKLALLQHCNTRERLEILGHAEMALSDRQEIVIQLLAQLGLPQNALGPIKIIATLGPDHAGRYEILFAALREAMLDIHSNILQAVESDNLQFQACSFAPTTSAGIRLDQALDEVMCLPNLVRLFGEAATNNYRVPFSRHFADRIRLVLSTLPSKANPYLWQMLAGVYPQNAMAPWLLEPRKASLPPLRFIQGTMLEALERTENEYDFIHLSNILDWLSPEEAERTLELAWRAMRAGGCILVRQLNSNLDIMGAGSRFTWDQSRANAWLATDRSFFYRSIFLGIKS